MNEINLVIISVSPTHPLNINVKKCPLVLNSDKIIKYNSGQTKKIKKEELNTIKTNLMEDRVGLISYYSVCFDNDLETVKTLLTDHLVGKVKEMYHKMGLIKQNINPNRVSV